MSGHFLNMYGANANFSLPGIGGAGGYGNGAWMGGPTAGYNPASAYNSLSSFGSPQNTGFNFGLNPESFGMISDGLSGLTSLAQIYGMFQSLGLQKKAFKFAQEGTKRNFNASATAYNDAVASKETARHAYANANNQDFNSLYGYGTGKKIDNWA